MVIQSTSTRKEVSDMSPNRTSSRASNTEGPISLNVSTVIYINTRMFTYVQTDLWKATHQSVTMGYLRAMKYEGKQFLVLCLLLYLIFSSTPFVFKQNHNSVKNKLPSCTDHPLQCEVLHLPHS